MMKDTYLNAGSRKEMLVRFAAWRQKSCTGSLAFYGRGQDYLAIAGNSPDAADCLIDDAESEGSISVVEAVQQNPDTIVPTSRVHQELMRRRLRDQGFEGEIVMLYENDPEIGSLAALAYDAARDWPRTTRETEAPTTVYPQQINRVLLVAPPFDVANHRHKKTMPMGLLYVAASIREALPDIQLDLIDAHIQRLSWADMKQKLDESDFDLLLVSYWSAQSANAYAISDYVRASKAAFVVHGGVHPTLCPDEAMQHCDTLITHEGEEAVVDLILELNAGGDLPFSGHCAPISDLDDLPFPAWDLLPDVTLYDHPMHVVGGRRFPILGSRGCPFNCTFCSSPVFWERKVRWRQPANVVDEMDRIHQCYGIDKFHFWDDNMVMNRTWITELCDELLSRNRSYQWCGLSRASDLVKNRDVLPQMREAGCVGMEIGVESFADQVSDVVDKGEHVDTMKGAVACMREANIAPLYTHMLFTPGETIASYQAKEQFLAEVNRDTASAGRSDSALGQLTTPHVGTQFAGDAAGFGTVLWQQPSDSFHHRVNFLPDSLLDDVPRRNGKAMPDPLSALGQTVQAIYNWTDTDMRAFVRCAKTVWENIDGQKTVRALAEANASELGPNDALRNTALLTVFWARDGVIASAKQSG